MNGFRCAGHCDADWPHAGDKAETVKSGAVNDADGNDSGYRTIKRVAPDSGDESWCVTDKHNERGRGWPGFKKRFILCDKQKTSDDYGTPASLRLNPSVTASTASRASIGERSATIRVERLSARTRAR